ncbi:flavin-containing monooxygenase 1-like isoform X1 [Styela clava]
MAKRVCVVGAGVSGVCTVKSCVEEGLDPTCYETREGVGGLWLYKKGESLQRSRVYESLVSNVSKEASCFSDFPYPKNQTPYCSHTKIVEYLTSYVEHFNLGNRFIFNTIVENIERQGLHKSGEPKWRVTIRNLHTSSRETLEYDAVIICGGRDGKPKMPDIDGLSDGMFEGEVMHSCQFDSSEIFLDKTVVVIGLGNSGADIAVEVSRKAKKTIMSRSAGSWMIPRIMKGGLPEDMQTSSRFNAFLKSWLPEFVGDWLVRKIVNSRFNHDALGISPRYKPGDRPNYLVNDEFPSRIVSGKVVVKPEIEKLDANSVYFSDGTKEKVDIVICATGYDSYFPFISDDILPDDRSQMKLFEWMFPFEMDYPESLAVVGVIPFSGGSQILQIECQSRYVAQIMSGIKRLPSVEEMKKAYEDDISDFVGQGRTFIFRRKIGFEYQDRVANLGGFYPILWKLLLRDPKLAFAVCFGPFMSYQYRLFGRHQWKQARERILNAIPNTLYAISSKERFQ